MTGLMTRCHTDLLLRILAYIGLSLAQPGRADMVAMFSSHCWEVSGLGNFHTFKDKNKLCLTCISNQWRPYLKKTFLGTPIMGGGNMLKLKRP